MVAVLKKVWTALQRRLPCVLLGSLIAFHALCNWLILKATHLPLIDDTREYYLGSLSLAHSLQNVFQPSSRPPLPMLVGSLWVRLLGPDQHLVVFATGLCFLVLLVLSVYGIGRAIGERRTGLWAAFLVSFYPAIFGHSRLLMADLPLAATVALFYWSILRSNYLRQWPDAIFVGLALALSSLTKPLFWAFILPALGAVGLDLFASRHRERVSRRLLMATVLFLCSAAPAALWYWRSLSVLQSTFFGTDFPNSWSTLAIDFHYYLSSLHNLLYLGSLFLLLLLLSLPFLWVNPMLRKHKGLLLAWVVLPYVILSILPAKAERFAMPILPALVLITTGLMTGLWSWLRPAIGVLALVATLANFFFLSFSTHPLPHYNQIGADGKRYIVPNYYFNGLFQAHPYDWGVDRAFSHLLYCAGDPPVVRFVQCPYLLSYGLLSKMQVTHTPFLGMANYWERCRDIHGKKIIQMEQEQASREDGAEVVIACDFSWGTSSCPPEQSLLRELIHHRDRYTPIGRFHLIDGTGVSISVRNQTCLKRWALPTPHPAEGQSLLIDAGSPSDRDFIEGTTVSEPGAEISADAPLEGIPRAALTTYRVGAFRYLVRGFALEAIVELWFLESYFKEPGRRIFDVAINGQTVLKDFDILANTARDVPVKRVFRVPIQGSARLGLRGEVEITFLPKRDLAMVNVLRVTFPRDAASPGL
jgi:hypothetical protein